MEPIGGLPASDEPIAIVGNINLDIRTSPIRATEQVLSDGETSVAEIEEAVGGGGANTALAAARLGGRVHFCGCMGADELGQRLRRHLERFGIATHLVQKDAPTGRSIALNWDNQQRHFLSSLPSGALLQEQDIDLNGLITAGCRHLYRADLWFSPRMLEGGNESLLRRAHASEMQTSVDLNWDPQWNNPDDSQIAHRINAVRAVLPHVSMVHGNERELCRFTGSDRLERAIDSILSDGAEAVIVHRGSRGSAAYLRSGESFEAPAVEVRSPKRPLGTGDAFTAAFLLLDHVPMAQRLDAANSVAAAHLDGSRDLMPRLGC